MQAKTKLNKLKISRKNLYVGFIGTFLIIFTVVFADQFWQTSAQKIDIQKDEPEITKQISPDALKQIQALAKEKESRTVAQKKIDSQLLYKIKMERNEMIAQDVPTLETGLTMDENGYIDVEITANVTKKLLKELKRVQAKILVSLPRYHSITASLPLTAIEPLAEMDEIIFISPKHEPILSQATETPTLFYPNQNGIKKNYASYSFEDRANNVRDFITSKIYDNLRPETGSVTSQGDTTHGANTFRATTGFNGAGIKIGVLSNGVRNLAASQASGNLPAVTVLPGQADGCSPSDECDEGTAMLEIVYDVAPGAQLYFATAFGGSANFAQNIKNLRAAGCNIIIDDVNYANETAFQNGQASNIISPNNSGVVVQAVNDVTIGSQAGALYFSSAGNSGNKNDGTSGVWEGDFVDGGAAGVPLTGKGNWHNFGGGNAGNVITSGSGKSIVLQWSDPLGGSNNDYDLYILNSTATTVVGRSDNPQNGTQDPIEIVSGANNVTGNIIVIVKSSGSSRFLHLNTNRGELNLSTSGVIFGHNGGLNTISVAASPSDQPFDIYSLSGPYPNLFNSTNKVEYFSSDGPRRIFYNADGSPITPGNISSTGGQILQKPDITAADGVSVTGVGGFHTPFFGTSAASPHAGALAALLKSACPSSTNTQLINAMKSTAIDIEAAGTDRDSGAGIFMPIPAKNALCGGNCTYSITPPSASIQASGGSGSVSVNASSQSCTWAAASNVSWITVTSGASGSGNGTVGYTVAANTGAARTGMITIAGQTVTINQSGASSTCTTASITLGQTINGTLQNGDCLLSDNSYYDTYTFTGTAGQQIYITLNSSQFNAYLILFQGAPSATSYAQDNDGGGGTNARIPAGSGYLTLPAAGTYTILANSNAAGETGNYSLSLGTNGGSPGTVQFSSGTSNINENGGSAQITVTRTGGTAAFSVNYATSNGTAIAGTHYTTTSGTLNFAASETSKTFSVPIIDNTSVDGNKTVNLTLSSPTGGATIGTPATAVLTILDNDTCTYTFNSPSAVIPATNGTGSFNVTVSTGCNWTATSNATAWLTTSSTGNGNGTVSYSYSANTGAARMGVITVGGTTVTINQSGASSTCTTASITLGQTINGTLQNGDCLLSDNSYYDTYTFTGTAGQQIYITLNSSQFNAYLILFQGAPSATSYAQDNDGGGGTNARIPAGSGYLTLPAAGTYTILANSNAAGETGNYSLFLGTNVNPVTRKAFDFDGDGKADISVFRPSNGTWYLSQSQNGFTGAQFGVSTDKVVSADFDGDGKTDIAVYRGGTWYLNRSTAGFIGFAFGDANDIPQPADFDGDGKADLAVWRPSNGTWYVFNLATNQFAASQFGAGTDKPVVGDYDGDGKADYAVFRPSNGTWYLMRSQLGFTGMQFGDAADKPVAADYDGDGKTDVAVFRPSNGVWYLNRSQAGFTSSQFGISTDLPVAADYDGDGKADIAVFRGGTWYLQRSAQGFTGVQFGAATDKPVPNAFIP